MSLLIDKVPQFYTEEEWSLTRMCFEIRIDQDLASNRALSSDGILAGSTLKILQGSSWVELTNEYLAALSRLPKETIVKGLIELNRAGILQQNENTNYRSLRVNT